MIMHGSRNFFQRGGGGRGKFSGKKRESLFSHHDTQMMELCFLIINNEFLAFSFIYQSELEKAALINNLPYRFLIDMDLKQLRIHVTRKLNTGLSNCL